MMRRTVSLITVVALSAAMLLLSPVTAFADANMEHSSCFGKYASTKETQDAGPGASVSPVAQTLGQEAPGGNEHAAQFLNQIRKEAFFC
jgi:hypothetical protein